MDRINNSELIEVPVSAPLRRNASVWVPARLKFEPTHDGEALTVKVRVVSDETYLRHRGTRWTVRANVPDVDFAPSEKITATIRLLSLECEEEDGFGDDGPSDEPSLYYGGFHTGSPHTWNGQPALQFEGFDEAFLWWGNETRRIDRDIRHCFVLVPFHSAAGSDGVVTVSIPARPTSLGLRRTD
jgi:hypothetical protein